MRAVELQSAANNIAKLLQESDVLSVIRECRAARGEAWQDVAALLHATGSGLSVSLSGMDDNANTVLKATHLDALATNEYWAALSSEESDEAERQAELVRLYSRVMFASNHLPMLATLLESEPEPAAESAQDTAADLTAVPGGGALPVTPLGEGEDRLLLKLVDAGELASNPDRIARAIDGIDMLYAACARLDRNPSMDLRLISVAGYTERDLVFVGEENTLQSIRAVVESIPAAIEKMDPEAEIDIDDLIQSLPVFENLTTLKKLGTYSAEDIKDLNDALHQGVLLSLESGVILVTDQALQATAAENDEYYDQYLRERERLASADESETADANVTAIADSRDAAVNNLLRGLDGQDK